MMLQIEHLKIAFPNPKGHFEAVKDFSLHVEEGQVIGIVGESGSGKSMTAHAIMGLLDRKSVQVSGSIRFEGVELLDLTRSQMRSYQGKDLSIIFQEPMTSLNPTMKIGPQVEEALRIHTKMPPKERKQRALEAMALAGLPNGEQLYHQYPHQLSGGMRQRAMIAMALSCNPKVLIADEPTTALDVTIQAQIMDLLAEIKEETNTAIILITHDLGVVAGMADRVAVMYAGKIVETGAVEDIFYRNAHPYTQALLKSLPTVDSDRTERLVSIAGTPPDLLNPPKGCAFAARCKHCMKICQEEQPPEFTVGEGHVASCWLLHPDCPSAEERGEKIVD